VAVGVFDIYLVVVERCNRPSTGYSQAMDRVGDDEAGTLVGRFVLI
jgi:hypothetical protein